MVAGGGWAPLHLVRKGYEATIPQLNQKPFVNDNLEWMKRNGYALLSVEELIEADSIFPITGTA